MRKQNIFLAIIFGLALNLSLSGCTSKKVDQENTDAAELTGDAAATGDETAGEVSELEDDFGGGDGEVATSDAPADEAAPAEGDAGGDVAADDSTNSDASADELDGLDDSAAAGETADAGAADDGLQDLAANDTPAETPADTSADAGTDSAAMGDSSTDSSAGDTSSYADETPKPVIPLQKVMTTPYTKNGTLLNAVYIARPGDTTESVSQKIYGQDKSAELKANNAVLARRSMKVGDKVYYNSPQRPSDSSQLLTYYEDVGLAPEVYLSKPGDNIRTVAKNLLGDDNSWKEVWSTNQDVESKAELPEGTRLRYWSSESSAPPAPVMATTTQQAPPPSAPAEMTPPPMPDDTQMAANEPPPPADMSQSEPPPPAMAEVNEPPPPAEPPPSAAPAVDTTSAAALGEDPDQMMALGAGAILLLAAIALFIIIRKKRARRSGGIDFQTATHTQIE